MQLFTIGVHMLNADGSVQTSNGSPIPTYDNSDIQTLARAWTGFKRQNARGNMEGVSYGLNRHDPMPINGARR